MTRTSLWIAAATAVLGVGLTACGGASDGCDRTVSPGADDRTTVQTMFEEAQDGETLCFSPGTYVFDDGVSLADLDGITLRGTGASREDVVLDFHMMGTGNSGLNISTVTHFRLEHLQVLDAAQNNVFITQSSDIVISDVSSGWVQRGPAEAGKYALYPVLSQRVLIEDSEAFGSADAGIYVGQTQDCIVRNSVAHDNVAGIEIENSSRCEVYGNEAYDNTAGILVFELPGIMAHGGSTLVHDNIARDNNTANFARDGIVARVPAGIGIMVLAANQVEVRDNTISGNVSSAITVVSYDTVVALGEDPPTDPAYDGYIDDVWLHDNECTNNGQAPDGALALVGLGATPPVTTLEDILFDTFQREAAPPSELCIDMGCTIRAAMPHADGTFTNQSTDPTPYLCTGATVAPVTLPSF